MNVPSELPEIINEYEYKLHNDALSRRRTIELAHKIDIYLDSNKSSVRTPIEKLKQVKKALNEANLPLTTYIFQQEAKIQIKKRYMPSNLQFSQPVSISISDSRTDRRKIGSQCDIGKELTIEERNRHIKSLQEIRNELADIQKQHKVWKMNKKKYFQNQKAYDNEIRELNFDIQDMLELIYSQ